MTDLTDLLARLESASEGSRELDARIWCAVRGHRFHAMNDSYPVGGRFFYYPATDSSHTYGHALVRGEFCTESLDAALSLVPSGWQYQLLKTGGVLATSGKPCKASIKAPSEYGWVDEPRPHDGYAHTMPLALCIAALKAGSAA